MPAAFPWSQNHLWGEERGGGAGGGEWEKHTVFFSSFIPGCKLKSTATLERASRSRTYLHRRFHHMRHFYQKVR